MGRGYQAAQRVVEVAHQPDGLRAVAGDGGFQRRQVDAVARVGGHFHRLQAQALQRLQGAVETRRLHHHGAAGLGDRRQAQVQRLQRAVGDDHVVHVQRHAIGQVAAGDVAAQAGVAGAQVIEQGLWLGLACAGGQRLRQLVPREVLGRGKGTAQAHRARLEAGLEDGEHAFADIHRQRGRGRQPGDFGFRRRVVGARCHVVAGTLARTDQPARLQQVVGLKHCGRADTACGAAAAHRGQLVARLQHARVDGLGDVGGQGGVARQAGGRGGFGGHSHPV